MDLDAVRPTVHPAGVRVAHDHDVSRPEETAAVSRVPHRGGKACQIDAVPVHAIGEHRAALDRDRWPGLKVLQLSLPGLDEFPWSVFERQPEADRDAGQGGEDVGSDSVAGLVARNVVEKQGRIPHVPLIEVGDTADLQVGIGTVDPREVADLVDAREPIPQIMHGHRFLQVYRFLRGL